MLPKQEHYGPGALATRIMSNRLLVRIVLAAAVALGVVGGVSVLAIEYKFVELTHLPPGEIRFIRPR